MFFIFNLFQRWQLRAFRSAKKPWVLFMWIGSMWLLHVVAMMTLEGLSLSDANWVTATTLTTVGYGDVSAKTNAGRFATAILLYAGGIFVLAAAVSGMTEAKAEKAALKVAGKWRWKLEDHILIVSPLGHENEAYYLKLISEIRQVPAFQDVCIQILSPTIEQIPERLKQQTVVHYRGTGSQSDLEACDYHNARAVIVLGDNRDPNSDALVFDIVSRIDPKSFVVAECINDESRERFKKVGADQIVRPARGYPEMIARALTAPGTEQIMEEMFSASGKTIHKVELGARRQVFLDQTISFLQKKGLGLVVATQDGSRMSIAPTENVITASCIYVLGDCDLKEEDLQAAVMVA